MRIPNQTTIYRDLTGDMCVCFSSLNNQILNDLEITQDIYNDETEREETHIFFLSYKQAIALHGFLDSFLKQYSPSK